MTAHEKNALYYLYYSPYKTGRIDSFDFLKVPFIDVFGIIAHCGNLGVQKKTSLTDFFLVIVNTEINVAYKRSKVDENKIGLMFLKSPFCVK